MTSASSRRGLLVTGLLVLAFLTVLDLVQHDSLLRRAWSALQPDRMTPAEQRLEELRRTRGQPLRR